jgi:PAS fold
VGHSVELLYQGPLSWLDLVHPEDRQRVADAIKQKSGSGQYGFEYRFTTADGAVRWVMSQSTEIYAPDGSLHRVVGIATDITQRKELEQQLRQSRKMEAVGQLAGGIAHDFNKLLYAVQFPAPPPRDPGFPGSRRFVGGISRPLQELPRQLDSHDDPDLLGYLGRRTSTEVIAGRDPKL